MNHPRAPRRRTFRALAVSTAVGLLIGGTYTVAAAPLAQAASPEDSSITIEWASGDVQVGADAAATPEEVRAAQPDHAELTSDGAGNDAGSGHWDDFKNLEVTVSKTAGLGDETITVSASGMAPTVRTPPFLASSFLQMFQCWGPNPLAEDFPETCQYGGFSGRAGARKSAAIYAETVSSSVIDRAAQYEGNVLPFRTAWDEYSEPFDTPQGGVDGTSAFFTDSSTNERPLVPVRENGTAETPFEVQSAAQAPHLGCGDTSDIGAGERCWLVIVPRGEHSNVPEGGEPGACVGPNVNSRTDRYGLVNVAQSGSPLSSACTAWNDRIVVPLDFDNPFQRCAAGGAERRVSGSELAADAVSSWQSAFCAVQGDPVAFSMTTNSGNLTRSQLLDGTVPFAVVSEPLTEDTIGGADPALLESAEVRYAPLANTAPVISYVISHSIGTVQVRDVKLTPRLVAKMLTQSYWSDGVRVVGGKTDHLEYLDGRPYFVGVDPEWVAVGNDPLPSLTGKGDGSFVVSGPAGDDAIRLLWEYVLADADAVAFLQGEPDPWGMRINPYYLPPGHPDVLGEGMDLLSAPSDAIIRADQSKYPVDGQTVDWLNWKGQQLDSITRMPYSGSLTANAQRIFRTDTRLAQEWDPQKLNAASEAGDFVAVGVQAIGNGQFILGPTTYSASERYDLGAVALGRPSAERTTAENAATARPFVAPSAASLSSALATQQATTTTTVAKPDMSALPADAYPLASTLYGAVDLNSLALDKAAADEYARFLEYAAGDGQVPGTARGQLPAGYAPLTDAQRATTRALAAELRDATRETPDDEADGDTGDSRGAPAGTGPGGAAAAGAPADPGQDAVPGTQVSEAAEGDVVLTAAVTTPGGVAVGAALAAGLAGLISSPLLLRRRDAGG